MMDYRKVRADIEADYKSVELMKKYVKGIMHPRVLGGLGGFSGTFSMSMFKRMEEPTLLPGTDSVRTKLKLAFLTDKHDTVRIDCMVMCINSVACTDGEPLFLLDYIACGKDVPEKVATIIRGVAGGCRQSDSALVGGETAGMLGFYPEDEYDLAGFSIDIVDKEDLITDENLCAKGIPTGVASSGIHNNGFSLVCKIFERELTKEGLNIYYDELRITLGEALIAPARIYMKALGNVKGVGVTVGACSHATGGGLYENIPCILGDGVKAVARKDNYLAPPVFKLLAEKGRIEGQMMYNACNMRLGVIVAANPADVEKAMETMKAADEAPYIMGSIEKGEKDVSLC